MINFKITDDEISSIQDELDILDIHDVSYAIKEAYDEYILNWINKEKFLDIIKENITLLICMHHEMSESIKQEKKFIDRCFNIYPTECKK